MRKEVAFKLPNLPKARLTRASVQRMDANARTLRMGAKTAKSMKTNVLQQKTLRRCRPMTRSQVTAAKVHILAKSLGALDLIPVHMRTSPEILNLLESHHATLTRTTHCPAFISGNQGSWTNSDDVKNGQIVQRRKPKQKQKGGTIVGRGAYNKGVRQAFDLGARAALKAGARTVAGALGAPQLGGLAESGVIELYNKASKFLKGHGEYSNADSMVQNVLMTGKMGPLTRFAGDINRMTITGEETLCTVQTGSVAGNEVIIKWSVNPGDSSFLPKLANTVSGFTRYNPMGMYFKFIPSMSLDLANGNYAMKMIYNAGANPITTFLECTDDTDSVTGQLGQPAMCGIECDESTLGKTWYMIRDGVLTDANGTTVPLTETDQGTMYFALKPASSVGANTQVGYIKVGYVYVVDSPRQIRSRFGLLNWTNTTGITNSTVFGTPDTTTTGVVRRQIGSLSGTTIKNNSIELTNANLNDYYRIRLTWFGGATAITAPTLTLTNCSYVTYFANHTATATFFPTNGTTTTQFCADTCVIVTSAEPNVATIALSGATLPSSASSVTVEIICLGNGLPATAY